MKICILLGLILISHSVFSQEKKIELKIREENSNSVSRISNENKLERRSIREESKNFRQERMKFEKHNRPHFDKNNRRENNRRENLRKENRNEIRHNRIERNNR
jgi:hypothetical protein